MTTNESKSVRIAPEYAKRLVATIEALASLDAAHEEEGVDFAVMKVEFYLGGEPAPYRVVWDEDYSGYVIEADS